jgi:hypothetical protein
MKLWPRIYGAPLRSKAISTSWGFSRSDFFMTQHTSHAATQPHSHTATQPHSHTRATKLPATSSVQLSYWCEYGTPLSRNDRLPPFFRPSSTCLRHLSSKANLPGTPFAIQGDTTECEQGALDGLGEDSRLRSTHHSCLPKTHERVSNRG